MKFEIIGILLFLFSLSLGAQESVYNPKESVSEFETETFLQSLHVTQNARIDTLLQRHIAMNKRMNGTDGYRLEVFFSSGYRSKEDALEVKTEFLTEFPDEQAYMIFQSPNFKIRVGNFRSKNEALALKSRIKRMYPNAFIVKDIIQFPKLYTERE